MVTMMPKSFLRPLEGNLGRFVGELFEDLGLEQRRTDAAATPPLDLFETANGYRLEFDLPGVVEGDVQVSIEDGLLELTAERKPVERAEGEQARYVERRHERFARRVRLPGQVDEDKIEATLENGVLRILIPKAAVAQPRRIEVRRPS